VTPRHNLLPVEDDWRDAAACQSAEAQPEWFGPVPPGRIAAPPEEALRFCRTCPVKDQCYTAGRRDPHAAGVYGGRYIRGRGRGSRVVDQ
jgi:hypothetical protein